MINDPSQNKKPLIFYMAVAVIVIILLNAFVFPMLLQRRVQEVGYSDFLKMVDSKQVSEVSMDENGEQLIFIAKGKDGQDGIYKTAVFPDNSLRQRLEDAGVSFSAQIPTQNNPLISFIISWIIPIALFWALGRILSKRMMGGMNALSFGKSGAKIVASESTGVVRGILLVNHRTVDEYPPRYNDRNSYNNGNSSPFVTCGHVSKAQPCGWI